MNVCLDLLDFVVREMLAAFVFDYRFCGQYWVVSEISLLFVFWNSIRVKDRVMGCLSRPNTLTILKAVDADSLCQMRSLK